MFLYVHPTSAPIVEPVTLAQIKQQCVVSSSFTDDDNLLTALGMAARLYAEKYTRTSFFNQGWKLTLDHFPTYTYSGTINPALRRDLYYYAGVWNGMTIALPKGRVVSIDSITYLGLSGTSQTLESSQYVTDFNSLPARIVPTPGIYWPLNTLYVPGSVAVNYTAASYALGLTESFTVPASAPFTYTPKQSPVTAVESVEDSSDNAVQYTFSGGVLTFTESQAGQSYTLTYSAGTIFPQTIAQAILLLTSHWYLNREAASSSNLNDIPFGVNALLDMHKVTILDYEAMV